MGWDSEASAAELMLSFLGGVLEVRDPGGGAKQTHDFDLHLTEGETLAVEVTRANIREHLQAAAEIQKRSWVCPELRSLWWVSFIPGRSVGDVHRRLPGILERLERDAVEELDVRKVLSPDPPDDPWSEPPEPVSSPDAEALRFLGIRRVTVIGARDDGIGEIFMNESPAIGSTNPGVAVRLACDMAWLPDNLAKLQAAESAAERHLFIWVESSRHRAVAAIGEDWLPAQAPALPNEVDVVWLAAAYEVAHVWRYSRSNGWEDLGTWRSQ